MLYSTYGTPCIELRILVSSRDEKRASEECTQTALQETLPLFFSYHVRFALFIRFIFVDTVICWVINAVQSVNTLGLTSLLFEQALHFFNRSVIKRCLQPALCCRCTLAKLSVSPLSLINCSLTSKVFRLFNLHALKSGIWDQMLYGNNRYARAAQCFVQNMWINVSKLRNLTEQSLCFYFCLQVIERLQVWHD